MAYTTKDLEKQKKQQGISKDTPDYVEDCVQDVFMTLLEARRSGTEIKSPKAWLTTVANNKLFFTKA